MQRILNIFCILLVSLCWASAELKWTPEGGWTSSEGVLSLFFVNPEDAKTGISLMNKAKEYQDAGEYFKALSAYQRVYKNYSTSVLAPEALFQEAEIYTLRRQYTPAFSTYDKILKQYPDYPKFEEVVSRQFDVACKLMQGHRPYYWGVIPGFKDYDSAIAYFEAIVDRAPYTEIAPRALLNIAYVAKEHGKIEQVTDALERLIYTYPNNPLTQEGYMLIADTYAGQVKGPEYDQAPTRKALDYYKDFLRLYPQSDQVSKAQDGLRSMTETLGQSRLVFGDFYYLYRNNARGAAVFYNDTIKVDPNSLAAEAARANLQKIKNKVPPPATPVDWLMGVYPSPQDNTDEVI